MGGYFHICPSVDLPGLSGHSAILWGQQDDAFGNFCSAIFLNGDNQMTLSGSNLLCGNNTTVYSTCSSDLFSVCSVSGTALQLKLDDCLSCANHVEMTLYGDLSVTGTIWGATGGSISIPINYTGGLSGSSTFYDGVQANIGIDNTVITVSGGQCICNDLTLYNAGSETDLFLSTYAGGLNQTSSIHFNKSSCCQNDLLQFQETRNNEILGKLTFNGTATAEDAFCQGASIYAKQNGSAGDNVPTDLYLTTCGLSSSNSDQLVLSHTGSIGIGTTDPDPSYLFHVDGPIKSTGISDNSLGCTNEVMVVSGTGLDGLSGDRCLASTGTLMINPSNQTVCINRYCDSCSGASLETYKTRHTGPVGVGSTSNSYAVKHGDCLFDFKIYGHDGSSYISTSKVEVQVEVDNNSGTIVSDNEIPTCMLFYTGSGDASCERLKIDSVGCITFNRAYSFPLTAQDSNNNTFLAYNSASNSLFFTDLTESSDFSVNIVNSITSSSQDLTALTDSIATCLTQTCFLTSFSRHLLNDSSINECACYCTGSHSVSSNGNLSIQRLYQYPNSLQGTSLSSLLEDNCLTFNTPLVTGSNFNTASATLHFPEYWNAYNHTINLSGYDYNCLSNKPSTYFWRITPGIGGTTYDVNDGEYICFEQGDCLNITSDCTNNVHTITFDVTGMNFDNYQNWKVGIGTTAYDIESTNTLGFEPQSNVGITWCSANNSLVFDVTGLSAAAFCDVGDIAASGSDLVSAGAIHTALAGKADTNHNHDSSYDNYDHWRIGIGGTTYDVNSQETVTLSGGDCIGVHFECSNNVHTFTVSASGVVDSSTCIVTNHGLSGGGDLTQDRNLGLTGQARELHDLSLSNSSLIVKDDSGNLVSVLSSTFIDNTNTYVTGGCFDNATNCITFRCNNGNAFTVDISNYDYDSLTDKPEHDNLVGFVANEHIDHTSVSFTGIKGIEGGGDISNSRTFCLSGQALCLHEASFSNSSLLAKNAAGSLTSVTTGAVADGSNSIPTSDGVFTFVASVSNQGNVNIDHTSVSINTTNGIQGGGDISTTRTLELSGNALCLHNLTLNNSSLIAKDSGGTWVSIASTAFVDSTGDTITGDLTIQGDLIVQGDYTTLNTNVSTTSAMCIQNAGTGPALEINQIGENDIVDFKDDNNSVFFIADGGNIGVGIGTNLQEKLTVVGNISASGTLYDGSSNSGLWGSAYTTVNTTSSNWDEAYNNYICNIEITTANGINTITLNQKDGDNLSDTFTAVQNSNICLNAGSGLVGSDSFTLNQSTDKTITFDIGEGSGITVGTDSISISATCLTKWDNTYTTVNTNSGTWCTTDEYLTGGTFDGVSATFTSNCNDTFKVDFSGYDYAELANKPTLSTGTVQGSGTVGTIPIWTTNTTTLGDSLISKNADNEYCFSDSYNGDLYFTIRNTTDSGCGTLKFCNDDNSCCGYIRKFGTSNTDGDCNNVLKVYNDGGIRIFENTGSGIMLHGSQVGIGNTTADIPLATNYDLTILGHTSASGNIVSQSHICAAQLYDNGSRVCTSAVQLNELSVGDNATASGSGGLAYNSSNGVFTYTPPVIPTDTNNYLSAAEFDTSNGVLTLGRHNLTDVTVDLDGKYAESQHTHSSFTCLDLTTSSTTSAMAIAYRDQFKKTYTTQVSWTHNGCGLQHFNLIFPYNASQGYMYDFKFVTDRNSNYQNFGFIRDNSYIYIEGDGDFLHRQEGLLQAGGTYSNSITLQGNPTVIRSDSPSATTNGGTSPYDYFIVRYPIYFPNNNYGTAVAFVHVDVYSQNDGATVAFLKT